MRLEITGSFDALDLETVVGHAISAWFDKLSNDNPDIAEAIGNSDARISSLTVDIQIKPDGTDEWQVLTTDNHEGIPELLVVKMETDENGNLLLDTLQDNDGKSDFTEMEALIATGNKHEFKVVETIYLPEQLQHVETFYLLDNDVVISLDTDDQVVVQVYGNANENVGGLHLDMVGEVVFPESELHKLLYHYGELADLKE